MTGYSVAKGGREATRPTAEVGHRCARACSKRRNRKSNLPSDANRQVRLGEVWAHSRLLLRKTRRPAGWRVCRNDCFSARMVPRSLQSRLPTKPSLATAALLLMVSCPTWALARGRISLISFSDTNRTEYV